MAEDSRRKNSKQWTSDFLGITRNRFLHRMRRSLQVKVFAEFVTDKNAVILDVGCGNGTFLKILAKEGYNGLWGVEPNEDLLKDFLFNAPEWSDKIKHGSAGNLPFRAGDFDCVLFLNVLHHLTSAEEYRCALNEANRCLRDGGVIIMVEPCNRYIYEMLRVVSYVMSPFSNFFREIYTVISEEMSLVRQFIAKSGLLREYLVSLGYEILRDRRCFHQWILISRRGDDSCKTKGLS